MLNYTAAGCSWLLVSTLQVSGGIFQRPHPTPPMCPLFPQEGYSLTLTVPESDRFLDDKADILEGAGFTTSHTWKLAATGDGTPPEEMMAFLRLKHLGGESGPHGTRAARARGGGRSIQSAAYWHGKRMVCRALSLRCGQRCILCRYVQSTDVSLPASAPCPPMPRSDGRLPSGVHLPQRVLELYARACQ